MLLRVLVNDIIIVHVSQNAFVRFKHICFYVRETSIFGLFQRIKIAA